MKIFIGALTTHVFTCDFCRKSCYDLLFLNKDSKEFLLSFIPFLINAY